MKLLQLLFAIWPAVLLFSLWGIGLYCLASGLLWLAGGRDLVLRRLHDCPDWLATVAACVVAAGYAFKGWMTS